MRPGERNEGGATDEEVQERYAGGGLGSMSGTLIKVWYVLTCALNGEAASDARQMFGASPASVQLLNI